MPTQPVRYERPTLSSCAEKWIRMNDKNCKATVNWYKVCAELANKLNGTRRETYSTTLIDNIKMSSDNYFKSSKKPLSTLSVIQKELGSVVEKLLFPPRVAEKFNLRSEPKSDLKDFDPTEWDINPETVMKALWWLGILTTILTIVILFILCLYCVQYRKMKMRLSKKDPGEYGDMQGRAKHCECSRRLWDTGEPRRLNKPPPPLECDSSEFCESDQELSLKFTVPSSCQDDSSDAVHKTKSAEQRRKLRTKQ